MKKSLFFLVLNIYAFTASPQVDLQWANRYNPQVQGANYGGADYVHLVVDDEGSVYVCGSHRTVQFGSDIYTVKYNAQGNQVWAECFDSNTPEAYYNDYPCAMAIDHENNILIAGTSSVVSGTAYSLALLVKYSPEGDTVWTRKFAESASWNNIFQDVAIDGENNIYVTGTSRITTSDYEAVTIKYDKDGNRLWKSVFDYADSFETVDEICLDPTGDYFYLTVHSANLMLIKHYCSTGDTTWSLACPNSGYGYLATDQSGNVFIATTLTQQHPNRGDMKLIKITSGGAMSWTRTYGCEGYGSDYPRAIKTDPDNNVYVTGTSFIWADNYSQLHPVWTTIKYNTSGDVLWLTNYDRPGHIVPQYEVPADIEFDHNGNVLVAGQAFESSILGYDYVVETYNRFNGEVMDTYYYYNVSGTVTALNDFVGDMAIDDVGNVFVTGILLTVSNSQENFGTIKLSPLNNTISATYTSDSLSKNIADLQETLDTITLNVRNEIKGDHVVRNIKVFIDSVYHTNDPDLEFYLIHNGITDTLIYGEAGGANFKETFMDDASPIGLNDGLAPFTGTYQPHSPFEAFKGTDPDGEWILKIYDNAEGNTGVLFGWKLIVQMSIPESTGPGLYNPSSPTLEQNYPNPFSHKTGISFKLDKPGLATLQIFDIAGKLIYTLVDEKRPAGEYYIEFDSEDLPHGVYFYRLCANQNATTKKMLLIK